VETAIVRRPQWLTYNSGHKHRRLRLAEGRLENTTDEGQLIQRLRCSTGVSPRKDFRCCVQQQLLLRCAPSAATLCPKLECQLSLATLPQTAR